MSSGTTLILACVLAVGAAGATVVIVAPSVTDAGGDRAEQVPAGLDPARVAALEEQLERLTRSVDAMQMQLAAGNSAERVPAPGVRDEELERAVDRWLAEHAADLDGELAAAMAPHAASGQPAARPLEDILSQLDHATSDTEWSKLWKEIESSGRMEEALAYFEARVAANPNDPDTHVEVAGAYLAMTQQVGAGPEAGVWATKADKAFDAALELDPEHWEARFMKATSLSFWPPLFGKQGEAIQNFEVLLGQQKQSGGTTPRYAETYLYLGNLYQQTGKSDLALQTWKDGLALYPDQTGLLDKLAAYGKP